MHRKFIIEYNFFNYFIKNNNCNVFSEMQLIMQIFELNAKRK